MRINPLKKNIPGQPEVAFRTGRIDYQFGCIDTLKRELHGTTKESEQLLAQDLAVPNESLKAKGQQPIEAPPANVANQKTSGSGGKVSN
ncbi:MAG: hypothetical protein DME55_11855 [Verrucomicrobia bacterium]|nr:MAG: hypothetical protein DME55_11855 [Verrucomicrobiota bacterium]